MLSRRVKPECPEGKNTVVTSSALGNYRASGNSSRILLTPACRHCVSNRSYNKNTVIAIGTVGDCRARANG